MKKNKLFPIKIDFYSDQSYLDRKELNKIFGKALKKIECNDRFQLEIYTHQSPQHIKLDGDSDISFFEISKGSPAIMFNSGYLMANKAILQLFCEGQAKFDLPLSIVNSKVLICENLNRLIHDENFMSPVMQILAQVTSNYFNFKNHINKIWFKKAQDQRIHVIGGPDYDEKLENADPAILKKLADTAKKDVRTSNNDDVYKYGDKDTFIDSCIFLSKYFSNPTLVRAASNEKNVSFNDNENMVIIGGPGSTDDEGNIFCRHFMKEMGNKFSYHFDNTTGYYIKNGLQTYFPEYDPETRDLTTDYGYFACFNNPRYPDKRIILINGIHTISVLAAFLAFSDNDKAGINYQTILEKVNNDDRQRNKLLSKKMLEFECLFKVEINNKKPKVPEIKAEDIFFFDEIRKENVRSENNVKPDEKITLSQITGLKEQIFSKINSTLSKDTFAHKTDLRGIHKSVSTIETLSSEELTEILKRLQMSDDILPENIYLVKEIIKANLKK